MRLLLFFWTTFLISIFILFNSIGLFLIVSSILLIPLTLLHIYIGINLKEISQKKLLYISSFNFLLFSLVRIDGVHAMTHSGLSALLRLVDIQFGYYREYENVFLLLCLGLMVVQTLLDIMLVRGKIFTKK